MVRSEDTKGNMFATDFDRRVQKTEKTKRGKLTKRKREKKYFVLFVLCVSIGHAMWKNVTRARIIYIYKYINIYINMHIYI